jgi:D-cysteine desulfhydrase family pyridoxal phosphate-dependent enzyme
LAHLPTPLEPLDRLAQHLGGPSLLVKRDDCTGLALGGNKTRKLEFLMGDALAQGADTVITAGGVQSNHVRQTAAAAARLGLHAELVLTRIVPWDAADYEKTGNILLDRLLGARVRLYSGTADRATAMAEVAEEARARGRRPYIIPTGGSNPVGALGYAACAQELAAQARDLDLDFDYLVHASSSGGTQAGLALGLAAIGHPARVVGIDVDADPENLRETVRRLAEATAEHLGLGGVLTGDAVTLEAGYAGRAYGLPTEEMHDAVALLARLEGLLLDPVYTGKAMAGLIGLIRQGRFKAGERIVFLHSGGAPALFAYRSVFQAEPHAG